jgi:hypothetical protein
MAKILETLPCGCIPHTYCGQAKEHVAHAHGDPLRWCYGCNCDYYVDAKPGDAPCVTCRDCPEHGAAAANRAIERAGEPCSRCATGAVLEAISSERAKQIAKWGDQRHPTGPYAGLTTAQRLQRRAEILAGRIAEAHRQAQELGRAEPCGRGQHGACRAEADRCLCECHDPTGITDLAQLAIDRPKAASTIYCAGCGRPGLPGNLAGWRMAEGETGTRCPDCLQLHRDYVASAVTAAAEALLRVAGTSTRRPAAYVNTDDGYPWLTCAHCEAPLLCVDGGTGLGRMLDVAAEHRCDMSRTVA